MSTPATTPLLFSFHPPTHNARRPIHPPNPSAIHEGLGAAQARASPRTNKRTTTAPVEGDEPTPKKTKTDTKPKPASKTKAKANGKVPVEKKENLKAVEEGAEAPKPKAAAKAKKLRTAPPAAKEAKEEDPAGADSDTDDVKVLTKGDTLPNIVLKDEAGKEVDVATLAGEKGAVLFLYPKADTPGCTNQACGFRDAYAEISALGYDVYGLSKDKPEAQNRWKTKKSLSYSLLSDPESQLIKRLGAFVLPKNTKRSHFIFEKGSGKLIDIAIGVKPANDPTDVLKFLQKASKV